MFDCSQLKGHPRAICEGTHRKASGRTHTLQERREIVGRYLRIDASQIELPMPKEASRIQSEIGTRLHAIIERDAGAKIECSDCRDEVTKLNLLTSEQVQAERESIAIGIVNRGKDKAPKFWMRWGAKLSPGVAKLQALAWIDEACKTPKPKDKPAYPLEFVTSVTVGVRAAKRKTPRLTETVASIFAAGFPKPIVFAEPDSCLPADITWPEKLGPIKSFKAMCLRLLDSPSEWLLLCEDDGLFSYHTADLVRTWHLTNEVVSFFVSGPRQVQCKGLGTAKGVMVGSMAVLLRKATLRLLTSSKTWRDWKKRDCVDQLIQQSCREVGSTLLTHNPSLLQHTGDTPAIYENRKLTELRIAKDWTPDGSYVPQSVTLITPTGDRQESFKLCEQWMRQQSYTGPIQWIVVDDGVKPTTVTMGQQYVRESQMKGHSLCRNLRSAIPHITGDIVFVIEDDDYYHPHYLSTMAGRLRHADLVGEFGAKYYYIRHNKWRHRHFQEQHASLCRTGMTRAVLPTLLDCSAGHHPSVDLRLWANWKGSKLSWIDEVGNQSLCVGIKGVRGRQSSGWRPVRDAKSDPDGSVLRLWVGDDSKHYRA